MRNCQFSKVKFDPVLFRQTF